MTESPAGYFDGFDTEDLRRDLKSLISAQGDLLSRLRRVEKKIAWVNEELNRRDIAAVEATRNIK